MSLAISLKSELLKSKRSAAWILTFVLAAFAPILVLLIFDYDLENNTQVKSVIADPWNFYFRQGWGIISVIFLPMFVVLISTLLPQLEYRNHTWKQVFASPQSFGKLYAAKFIVIQLFILTFLLAESLFMGISCLISNTLYPKFNFFAHSFDWAKYLTQLSQSYVAILCLSALQFCLGLRFKSFLLPIGIAALLGIFGIINLLGFHMMDTTKFPISYSAFIIFKENASKIPYVLWSSTVYAVGILALGFFDFRRIRGL